MPRIIGLWLLSFAPFMAFSQDIKEADVLRLKQKAAMGDRLAARAGVRKINPYILRHTFATWQSEGGVESTALSQMMGHSTTRMLERYVSNTHEHYMKAVTALQNRLRKSPSETASPAKEGENLLPNLLPAVSEGKRTCDAVVTSPSSSTS